MAIRWLSRSRQSMQRLGFCKAVLALSEPARTSREMAEVLRARLEEQKFLVPFDEALSEWLKRSERAAALNPEIWISLQKLYVYGHPSRSGWLSRLAFNEYVEYLPRHLGLVTNTYDTTDMGLVLAHGLMSKEEHQAFNRPSEGNPLVLKRGEQIFFLHSLLAADGDFLLPFCEVLLNRFSTGSFDYLEVGSLLPEMMNDILSRFSGSAYTQLDRELLERLAKARQQIIKNIEEKAEEKGTGSRREQTTMPHLEWLVDLGFLERVDVRRWRISENGFKLAELCEVYQAESKTRYPENVIGAILASRFYQFAAHVYAEGPYSSVKVDQFFPFILRGYKSLVGVGGYCLLRPLLLYANILSMVEGRGLLLEYDPGVKMLENIYQSDPTTLHYTIDRFGTDYQVKVGDIPAIEE